MTALYAPFRSPWTRALATVAATLLLLAAPAAAATQAVSIHLEPEAIGLHEEAVLRVTVQGEGKAPTVPRIEGLRFEFAGRSTRIETVGGHVQASETYVLRVIPQRVGTYRIDPADFAAASQRSSGPVLELAVTPTPPTSLPSPAPPVAPPPEDENQPFLRVVVERDRPYVGELVPARIEAWFPEGVRASLEGVPTTSETAFTLDVPEQEPELRRRIHGGKAYRVVSWDAAVVGVKEGPHHLSLEVGATLRIPQRRPARGRRRAGPRGFFDDDFFAGSPLASMLQDDPLFGDDLLADFFGRTIEKSVTLRTEGPDVEVRALPDEGRPSTFSGAVGTFDLSVGPLPPDARTGDPITVESVVSGRGNFGRVRAPIMAPDSRIKGYEPEVAFEADDRLGAVGRKRFEQALVVRDPAVEEIPAFSFAYFDPDAGRYEVLETPATPIEVEGPRMTPTDDAPAGPVGSPAESAARPAASREPTDALAYVPLPYRASFRAAIAALAAALVLGVGLVVRRRHLERHPDRDDRRRARESARVAREAFDASYRAGDAAAFFPAARRLLQLALGRTWDVEPASITGAELRERLPVDAPPIAVFDAADAVAFGGHAAEGQSLALWRERVLRALESLESDR